MDSDGAGDAGAGTNGFPAFMPENPFGDISKMFLQPKQTRTSPGRAPTAEEPAADGLIAEASETAARPTRRSRTLSGARTLERELEPGQPTKKKKSRCEDCACPLPDYTESLEPFTTTAAGEGESFCVSNGTLTASGATGNTQIRVAVGLRSSEDEADEEE